MAFNAQCLKINKHWLYLNNDNFCLSTPINGFFNVVKFYFCICLHLNILFYITIYTSKWSKFRIALLYVIRSKMWITKQNRFALNRFWIHKRIALIWCWVVLAQKCKMFCIASYMLLKFHLVVILINCWIETLFSLNLHGINSLELIFELTNKYHDLSFIKISVEILF